MFVKGKPPRPSNEFHQWNTPEDCSASAFAPWCVDCFTMVIQSEDLGLQAIRPRSSRCSITMEQQ